MRKWVPTNVKRKQWMAIMAKVVGEAAIDLVRKGLLETSFNKNAFLLIHICRIALIKQSLSSFASNLEKKKGKKKCKKPLFDRLLQDRHKGFLFWCFSEDMCPFRFILVFLSAVLAGYFAWKTVRSSPEIDDMVSDDSTAEKTSLEDKQEFNSKRVSRILFLFFIFMIPWV